MSEERRPYLVDEGGRRFPLATPAITIGRSPTCQVVVADRRTSRRHAELQWDGFACTLRDLGSANGTYVHGQRVSHASLQDGDEIQIASALFTYRDPDATVPVRPLHYLAVNPETGAVSLDRRPITLSPKEKTLFHLLHAHAGRTCTKQQIAEAVWPEYQAAVYDYQIERLVKRLRAKLEPDPKHPMFVINERGFGYRLILTPRLP